ncbi:hypothetical protein CVIRNUC_010187 [Coccomyxa viridis]|uniref:Uncharacterized protein n=1 Tax=Coccomyxa viridis TaxID=1274662 RepID=A0AAV1IJH5_9CHLO|nr:hypothetical protein CVIRNUC_010187 [Coccomyxa viridis]
MMAGADRRCPSTDRGGSHRTSFNSCASVETFAVSSMGPLRRLSNAADRAAEARNHLSGGSFELNPAIAMQPVKRLSEELAAALKARNSWTATVAPFPNAMKADPKSASVRSSMDASSSSRVGAVHGVAAEGLKEKENQDPHEQQQHHNHNPWYSLLSCRLLSFIGGGNMPLADHEEIRNTVMPVISSHRLSAERRFSESSMHSIRSFSLDGEDSPTFASARRRGSLGGRPSYGRRCAHEFAREGGYERDTTFYSEMAAGEAPHTSIRGLSTSLDRARSERLSSVDGKPLPICEEEEATLERMALRRRREAVREAWRRSASTDTEQHPSMDQFRARPALPAIGPVPVESSLDDFTNDELRRRNDIFQGRL